MEDHFKNKLRNHKVDWDKEALLPHLQRELSKSKSSFGWRWLWLLPILLMGTCWGWQTFSNQEGVKNNMPAFTENYSEAHKDEQPLLEDIGQQKTQDANNEKNPLASNAQSENTKEDVAIPTPVLEEKTATRNNKIARVESKKQDQPLTKRLFSSRTMTQQPEVSFTTQDAKMNIDSKGIGQHSARSGHSTITGILASDANVSNNGAAFSSLDIGCLDHVEYSLFDVPLFTIQTSLPALDSVEKVISEIPNWQPFVDVGTELAWTFRTRNYLTENTEYINRLRSNEETETPLTWWHLHANAGLMHKNTWSLQTGFQYDQIREVFNYSETKIFETENEDIRYFIVDGPDTTFVFDTITVTRIAERQVRHYNTHHLFSIPLELGYRFEINAFRFEAQAGLSYSFFHNYNGKRNFVFESGGNEIIENALEFAFELKDRIGYKLGLGMVYPVFDKNELFVTATYRRSPTLSIRVIDQRYNALALGVGLRLPLGQ